MVANACAPLPTTCPTRRTQSTSYVNDAKPEARISGRIQCARPPASAPSPGAGAASRASAGAERATAHAVANTSALTAAAVAIVA